MLMWGRGQDKKGEGSDKEMQKDKNYGNFIRESSEMLVFWKFVYCTSPMHSSMTLLLLGHYQHLFDLLTEDVSIERK